MRGEDKVTYNISIGLNTKRWKSRSVNGWIHLKNNMRVPSPNTTFPSANPYPTKRLNCSALYNKNWLPKKHLRPPPNKPCTKTKKN